MVQFIDKPKRERFSTMFSLSVWFMCLQLLSATLANKTGPSSETVPCQSLNGTVTVKWTPSQRNIPCGCISPRENGITWRNQNCQTLSSDESASVANNTLVVIKQPSKEWFVYCSIGKECSYKIIIVEEKTGMSTGVQGFLVFLIVAVVFALGFFVLKKYRLPIYLCCRDSCASSSAEDGKDFDAFVSVGKNTSDIKYIEKNLTEILRKKFNYKLLTNDENLLPRLEYSEMVQGKMHKCRRLIVVFTPAYMTNEWCMYCFSEGLRKLLDLKIEMIFVVSDISIMRELNTFSSLVGHVPKIFMSVLPMAQNKRLRDKIIEKIRYHMPAPRRGTAAERGMRAPMLSEAEDIDQRSVHSRDERNATKYTFEETAASQKDDIEMIDVNKTDDDDQALEYDDENPDSIRINQYEAKKDFFRIAMVDPDL